MRAFALKPNVSKQIDSAKFSMSSRELSIDDCDTHPIHRLQPAVGRQAGQGPLRLKTEDLETSQRGRIWPEFVYDFSRLPIRVRPGIDSKAKLKMNRLGDIYEQEADRIADQVINMTDVQVQQNCGFGDQCAASRCRLMPNQTQVEPKLLPMLGEGRMQAPAVMHEGLPHSGRHLDSRTLQFMESRFGHLFGRVNIHTDARAAESALTAQALAYTMGDNIVFGAGQYAPHTIKGRRLLAHELAHVMQQQGGTTVRRPGVSRLSATPIAPQHNDDVAALRARLAVVRARLRVLRTATGRSQERFEAGTARERQAASQRQMEQHLQTQIIQQRGARQAFPHTGVATRVRRIASANRTGNVVTVSFPIQLTYLSMSESDAQRRVATDVQRIRDTIRDIWQVNIQSGEYAGIQFRVNPTVTYLRRGEVRASNAFLIQVRGADSAPSSGDGATGIISLAFAHLARVRVVAHELAHLFGFIDTYLEAGRTASGGRYGMSVVGRQRIPGQADLLGMIDPVVLARWRREGTITAQQQTLQSGTVNLWEGEASQVLRILGVHPPAPSRPTPGGENFDPTVELERLQQEGEARLAETRRRRERSEESVQWIGQVEEIMRLEREERSLQQRIRTSQTP